MVTTTISPGATKAIISSYQNYKYIDIIWAISSGSEIRVLVIPTRYITANRIFADSVTARTSGGEIYNNVIEVQFSSNTSITFSKAYYAGWGAPYIFGVFGHN